MAGSNIQSEEYKRTIEDATNMLICAKQKEEEVSSVTQVFYYPTESECKENINNLRLFSIDEEFIKKLESGERFSFKGCNKEKIVFCTEDETYEVKEGDISNSLIICPNLLYNSDLQHHENNERVLKQQTIYGVHHSYLELRLTFPKLSKLKALLTEVEYTGPKENPDINNGYYFFELLDIIQCSRQQLQENLKEIRALCLDDKWRGLNITYETEVLSYMISVMEKQKWDKIHGMEIKQILNSIVPEFIIDHILLYYTTQLSDDENLYTFKEDVVNRCFAEVLLKTAEGRFRYNEFIMAWERCLNPVIKADINHLKGLALIEKEEGQQKIVHLYPEYDLPENISERFRLLFKRKEKWTLEEITPYIE
ncbi:hypothetical protein RUM43_002696 [Polyplax serrata]|uniref:Sister chromatid cohesion protein DCC1 n=1 Tax=Polyplax serrata TaxID=468196 RepID=A0AAN8NZ56_POLSC